MSNLTDDAAKLLDDVETNPSLSKRVIALLADLAASVETLQRLAYAPKPEPEPEPEPADDGWRDGTPDGWQIGDEVTLKPGQFPDKVLTVIAVLANGRPVLHIANSAHAYGTSEIRSYRRPPLTKGQAVTLKRSFGDHVGRVTLVQVNGTYMARCVGSEVSYLYEREDLIPVTLPTNEEEK